LSDAACPAIVTNLRIFSAVQPAQRLYLILAAHQFKSSQLLCGRSQSTWLWFICCSFSQNLLDSSSL